MKVYKQRRCNLENGRKWPQILDPTVYQFSSVQSLSCVRLCNPMDWSTPGLPVQHQLPEFTQTYAHWVSDSIQPSHPVVPFFSCLQSFPASGSFQMSQLFASDGQSIGVSALSSVLPMSIQDWFPAVFTGLISLLSKGLSRVLSNSMVQKHQFSAFSFLYSPTLISIHDYWKNHKWSCSVMSDSLWPYGQ